MICRNCGHECPSGKFCSECGSPLEEVKVVDEAAEVEETKAQLPSLDELKEIAKSAEDDVVLEDDVFFHIDKAEYDKAVEIMGVYKAKSHLPFYLAWASMGLSVLSLFSLIYYFGTPSAILENFSMITAYFNLPAFCLALAAFACASHWFLAAKKYKYLKKPSFITFSFVWSILAVVFTFTCFCAFTIPVIFFPF